MNGPQIGTIFLENQWISSYQLSQALEIQKRFFQERAQWKLLGEILVEMEYLDGTALAEAIAQQSKARESEFFPPGKHPSVHSKFKRAIDMVGALIGLVIACLLFPWIALAIVLDSGKPIFFSQYRAGLRGKQFKIWKFRTMVPRADQEKVRIVSSSKYKFFNNRQDPRVTRVGKFLRKTYLDELPQFWNVLKGEMSLVGTRPPTLDEVKSYSQEDWQRLSIKPGMTGLWQVSDRKNQASFDEVLELDMNYIRSWKRWRDLQIIAKTLQRITRPNALKRVPAKEVQILNLKIDNLCKRELLRKLDRGVVFTPNVDHLMKLQRDPEFLRIYRQADYRVCDSQILLIASKFLGNPLREKISGSDLFPAFYRYHRHHEEIKVFLLGGTPESVEIARENINLQSGREIIVGAYSPPFGFEKSTAMSLEIIERITRTGATVLAVGVGAPKQEKWIFRFKDCLPDVRIFLAIGATIEFEAGTLSRAPKIFSDMGLEWLYRLLKEPKRLWKRYLIEDIPFIGYVIQQKFGWYKDSIGHESESSARTGR
jgi:N-acetylglucosaminyldiphosphoundecaprenol N-acetyl-beta-D-mannosaminyltransferase